MIPVSTPGTIIETPDEREKVEGWRLKCLAEAGYPLEIAERIAREQSVDLHRACEIAARGCSPELAERILL